MGNVEHDRPGTLPARLKWGNTHAVVEDLPEGLLKIRVRRQVRVPGPRNDH